MIHYSVSIERHIERTASEGRPLTAGQVAILLALWSQVRNPFADQPVVFASYECLALRTGLSARTIEQHTGALKRAGCIRKGGSARGRGTEYTLLRPKHEADDAKRNPFDPSDAETAAEAAVAVLRADGRVAKPKKKAARVQAPAVKPSTIALALEDMAGIPPHVVTVKGKQVRKASLPYSAKCGDPSAVRAAQRFIAAHGMPTFVLVCERAKERGAFFDSADKRARLFEHGDMLADLLGEQPEPSAPVDIDKMPASIRTIYDVVVEHHEPERAAQLAEAAIAHGENQLWDAGEILAFVRDHMTELPAILGVEVR